METTHWLQLVGNGSIASLIAFGIWILSKKLPMIIEGRLKSTTAEAKAKLEEAALLSKTRIDESAVLAQSRLEERNQMFALMTQQMEADRRERREDRLSQDERSSRQIDMFRTAIKDSIEGCDKRTDKLATEFTAALREQTQIIKQELMVIKSAGKPSN